MARIYETTGKTPILQLNYFYNIEIHKAKNTVLELFNRCILQLFCEIDAMTKNRKTTI